MRLRSAALAVLACTTVAVPALAAGFDGTYKGQAKSLESDFRYGKVTVRVRDNKVRKLVIEGVTTTGCGGFMDVVFAPGDPDTKILAGSARIRNGRFSVRYRPVADIEDQETRITATFKGSRVTGKFESGDLCVNAGRFTARR